MNGSRTMGRGRHETSVKLAHGSSVVRVLVSGL